MADRGWAVPAGAGQGLEQSLFRIPAGYVRGRWIITLSSRWSVTCGQARPPALPGYLCEACLDAGRHATAGAWGGGDGVGGLARQPQAYQNKGLPWLISFLLRFSYGTSDVECRWASLRRLGIEPLC
jgi:hypothetical protein